MDELCFSKYMMQMKDAVCIAILTQAVMSSWNKMGAAAYDDDATLKKLTRAVNIAKEVYHKNL